ncbi:hypothetical protein AMECASPLE_031770 [Ameca splendens]|uniref:Uncharacterized protein n=1 Tax=Ameca splendens TaxID=208324 RepID=A0ABV0XVQ1_9TELE
MLPPPALKRDNASLMYASADKGYNKVSLVWKTSVQDFKTHEREWGQFPYSLFVSVSFANGCSCYLSASRKRAHFIIIGPLVQTVFFLSYLYKHIHFTQHTHSFTLTLRPVSIHRNLHLQQTMTQVSVERGRQEQDLGSQFMTL